MKANEKISGEQAALRRLIRRKLMEVSGQNPYCDGSGGNGKLPVTQINSIKKGPKDDR